MASREGTSKEPCVVMTLGEPGRSCWPAGWSVPGLSVGFTHRRPPGPQGVVTARVSTKQDEVGGDALRKEKSVHWDH